ncbi:MAG: transcription termination factor Rho [Acidimicrobiales bacterium]
MSADTQELERSALERKDRDELHTIAIALGGKPGSRAKKADIVDLILELAGVTASSVPTPDGPVPPETAATADQAEGAAPATRARRSRSRASEVPVETEVAPSETSDGESSADSDVETGTGADDDRSASRPARPQGRGRDDRGRDDLDAGAQGEDHEQDGSPNRVSNDRNRGRNGNGNTEGNDRDHAAAPSDRSQQGGQGQSVSPNQGQPNHGQAGGQGQPGGQGQGEGEPGNRRRRRRGRDRTADRPDQDQPFVGEPVEVEGLLDLRDEGYGFLRLKGYLPSKDDVYISVKQARQFAMRKGDLITGAARPAGRNEKNPAMLRIDTVNGVDPEQARERPRFEDLTPLFPDARLRLEGPNDENNMTARIADLVSPIGKGQRGLIVSPPKAGKTTIMKQIVRSIETNNPEVHLIVLLVDERPEEVTDMRRWVKGEVAASTFDRPAEEHTMVAELVIERAKRMVEDGKDVVIILDGITRLARAYNLAAPATGRIMSGGIDTGALYPPKKFFGAARNVEEGGSLTILATALVETGSKMDEVIFEEFKGTGNMELRLDRRLAERRIYPAIDVDASSTRHEELLFDRKQLQQVWKLRRVLSALAEGSAGGGAGLEMLIDRLGSFRTNDQFLAEIAKAPAGA